MKKTKLLLLFLISCFWATSSLNAQYSRFNAGFVAGLNFAALEGDEITDYFGINAGLIGTARLSAHTQLGLEFLFSQNGEYILPEYYPPLSYGSIWINHIEIPVHFDWLISVFKKDRFSDWNLNAGVAYSRLLGFRVEDENELDVSNQIIYNRKTGFLLQAGTTYFFTPQFGFNAKASFPMRPNGLSWTIAARLVYMIS